MATVDIELYYDLDRRRWTTSAGGLATQPSLFIGQSNTIDFKVRFVQGGVPIELTNPSFIAGVKVTDDPLGDYLLLTTTGTQTGSGPTTIYTFTLNIDSVELQAYLVGITPSTNSTAFEVRDTVNNIATLPAITCSILPDYTLTGATPAAGSGTLVVDSGATFTVHESFAMPVDDGQNNYVLKTNGAGVGSWAADNAGTGTVTNVAFTGGLISVANPTGSAALTVAGTAGGIVYFSSNSVWASSGVMGQGSLIVGGASGAPPDPVSAQTAGKVLISNGVTTAPIYSSTITLGASGTLGTITLGNATSGTILITPPTGALGTVTLTLPITSTTLAGLAVTQSFTQVNTFSNSTASTSSASGALLVTGGIGVALVTDATSSTNGGAVTIAGGLAVAKKAFIGSLLDIVATTSTAGQITQGGERFIHTYQPSGQNQNVFIGFQAGRTSTMSGGGNVGIGRAALQSLTGGANNLAFGDAAAYLLTAGSANIVIGQSNGQGLRSGNNNCLIGVGANNAGDTTSNSAFGYQSLKSTLNNSNSAFGFNAGNTLTGSANTNGFNSCFGYTAGSQVQIIGGLTSAALTTGTNNTMLGTYAGSTSATGTYRTAVGSDSICESNNAIKLGRDTLDVVLLPKMTQAQMATAAATLSAVKGAIVYCLDGGADADHVHFYNGTAWARLN